MLYNNIHLFPEKSFYYSIPYLLIAFITFFLLYNGTKGYDPNKKKSYIILFVLHLIFWGLRWHIMTDTLAYEVEFYTIKPIFTWTYLEEHSLWWDKGFVLFAMLSKLINPSFQFFIFINTLIDLILFSLCLKKYSTNFAITILAFLAFQGILTEINLLRNIKAILIFIYSIQYIEKRDLKLFIILNFIGYTFHASAIMFFPMYWILNKQYKLKYILILSILATIIYLSELNIVEQLIIQLMPTSGVISNKLTAYLTTSDESKLSIGTIERILTLILAIWVYYKTPNRSTQFTIFFNTFLCFYILYALFGFNLVFRDRIPYLFIFSYWFIYPYLFSFFTKKRHYLKYIFYSLFIMKIYTSTNMCSAYYENIISKELTRSQRSYLNSKVLGK